jgi:hypothetical protein
LSCHYIFIVLLSPRKISKIFFLDGGFTFAKATTATTAQTATEVTARDETTEYE